ncbi:predicted protein [Arabidopsis lyrata subsp. lyrata]|uniref:Predicted protein n=1 Tax=Arabidopsis lyrata subsp. lyrata TaxID=81972 RepID=D7KIE9_ARALL|nr:predicted protein [Arabidopsis lyrata subsp. lyrata]
MEQNDQACNEEAIFVDESPKRKVFSKFTLLQIKKPYYPWRTVSTISSETEDAEVDDEDVGGEGKSGVFATETGEDGEESGTEDKISRSGGDLDGVDKADGAVASGVMAASSLEEDNNGEVEVRPNGESNASRKSSSSRSRCMNGVVVNLGVET